MQGDIAVGMGDHAAIMGHAHPAKPDMVTGSERMDIVACRDPGQHG